MAWETKGTVSSPRDKGHIASHVPLARRSAKGHTLVRGVLKGGEEEKEMEISAGGVVGAHKYKGEKTGVQNWRRRDLTKRLRTDQLGAKWGVMPLDVRRKTRW